MKESLFKSTATVSGMTLLSRIVGFMRDMVIAQFFGASVGADAFFVAFKIPNFMRRLFAEGAFSQAFVPILLTYREKRSHGEVKVFLNHIAGSLGVILLGVTLLGVLFAPLFITIFAPGFSHEGARFALAGDMLRITFPYLLLISLTALSGAILNSYDEFAVPAFTPVLLNITMISSVLLLSSHFAQPIIALAWGVFIAGVLQLLFPLPFLKRKNLLPKPSIGFHDKGVRSVLRLMLPALFGVSVAQVNLLLDTIFASFLQIGSVSWLYYSDRLMSLPLGIFGVAVATVVLPHLSRQYADKAPKHYSAALDWGLRLLLIIGLPSTIGLIFLAGPLLCTLFQYGDFSAHSVVMARESLIAFGFGVQAFMLIKVLAAGFYAQKNIRTPVKVGVIAMVANMVFNGLFIWPLAHAGIALATSLAGIINASLLFILLRRGKLFTPAAGWRVFFFRLLVANSALAGFLWFASGKLTQWLNAGWLWRTEHLSVLVITGFVLYCLCLWILGLRRRDIVFASREWV